MFGRSKSQSTIPLDRIRAIAEQSPPNAYSDYGSLKKREPRMTVYKPAYVMLSYGEKVPVVVKNMNSTGLRIEFFQNTTLGERVQIVEPSIPLRAWAEVVWERNGASGLRLIDTG